MPNRILHESICTSESLSHVSESAELLFYRLLVNADDYGRFDARPAVIRARCFPLRLHEWPEERVLATLGELEAAGVVVAYQAEGHGYGAFVNWRRFQRIRAARSKFPSPDGELLTGDGGLLTEDSDSRLARAPAGAFDSDSDSRVVGVGGSGGEGFDAFWSAYPRKAGKPKAREAFGKALRRAPVERIVGGAARYRDDPNREPAFTAHPTTWLNRDGWDDDPLPTRNARDPRPRDIAGERIGRAARAIRGGERDGDRTGGDARRALGVGVDADAGLQGRALDG